ncbi:MAG: hypothetical protein GX663_02630 [Clostridiales bacterium]|nr:hypothetical protein [Clostridiales bacterium]
MKCMIIRAVKTFLQAFVASAVAGVTTMAKTGFDQWETVGASMLIASVAAGMSAVMNLPNIKNKFNDYGECENKKDGV